jgi:hypothetical protein
MVDGCQASLHNHIVYHALALFSLGSSPKLILSQSKRNTDYQLLPPKFVDEDCVQDMETGPTGFEKYIGKEEHFLDFCEFFERRLARDGADKVLQEYLLGENHIAKAIFPRLWHGKLPQWNIARF